MSIGTLLVLIIGLFLLIVGLVMSWTGYNQAKKFWPGIIMTIIGYVIVDFGVFKGLIPF